MPGGSPTTAHLPQEQGSVFNSRGVFVQLYFCISHHCVFLKQLTQTHPFAGVSDASFFVSHRGLNRVMNCGKWLRNTYFTGTLSSLQALAALMGSKP